MRLLALDVGQRRTGAAFCEEDMGVPLALPTIEHNSLPSLLTHVQLLAEARHIQEIILGHPLLLSGKEGKQAEYVRECAEALRAAGFRVHLLDERFTTPRNASGDGDAAAACAILLTFLARKGS